MCITSRLSLFFQNVSSQLSECSVEQTRFILTTVKINLVSKIKLCNIIQLWIPPKYQLFFCMQDISTYMFFSFSQKLLFFNAVRFGKSLSLVLLTT